MHPVVPFVTEALWQRLPSTPQSTDGRAQAVLAQAAWPTPRITTIDQDSAAAEYELVREAVRAVRQIRADYGIGPAAVINVTIDPAATSRRVFDEEAGAVGRLARCQTRVITAKADAGPAASAVLSDGSTVAVPLAGVIDVEQECRRLRTELSRVDAPLSALRQRLTSESFLARAPQEVVEREKTKEREWAIRAEELRARLRNLCPE